MIRSVLIGNGFNIQLGGQDFSNKWIIVRLLADALSGETDGLFVSSPGGKPSVDGKTIAGIITELPSLANKVRDGEYDSLNELVSSKDLTESVVSFKLRYPEKVNSPEEIGIEDWFLLLHLFLIEQSDLINLYSGIKQGFERLLLNSIYCNGKILQLWRAVNSKTKNYLNTFDTLFTVNYDTNLDKLVKKPVFHLHGDFETKHDSENPHTAWGFLRKQRGESIWFSKNFQHCCCNTLLDYSGSNKYKLAIAFSTLNLDFEKLRAEYSDDLLLQFPKDQRDVIQIGFEKNLPFGYDYHFNNLENLTGELTIIGLSPRNDSHIIECINKSHVSKIIFYEYKPTPLSTTLPFKRNYEIRDVSELWSDLELHSPKYQSPAATRLSLEYASDKKIAENKIHLVNGLTNHDDIDYASLVEQLGSIPEETEKTIVKFLFKELCKKEYKEKPCPNEEISKLFQRFSSALPISALSPQAIYTLYFTHKSLIKEN